MPEWRSLLIRGLRGIAAVMLAGGVLTACGSATTTNTTTSPPQANATTATVLTTVDGTKIDLPGSAPTVVLFFSYGCGECVGGGKSLTAARAAVEKAGGSARFLAVDMVPGERAADVRRFLGQIGGNSLAAVVDTDGALTSRYAVSSLTTVIVIDASGRVTYRGQAPSTDQILAALGTSASR